jgi:regulator of protease activity HflC (stomatin/prohibitin superfamily)
LDKVLSRVAMGAMGVMGAYSAVNSCIYDVDGGKRAIMFNRFPNPLTGEGSGIQKHIIKEGTHIKLPYFQEPKIFDVRSRPRAIPTVTGTKDLQMVNITLRLLSRPNMAKLPIIYQQVPLSRSLAFSLSRAHCMYVRVLCVLHLHTILRQD